MPTSNGPNRLIFTFIFAKKDHRNGIFTLNQSGTKIDSKYSNFEKVQCYIFSNKKVNIDMRLFKSQFVKGKITKYLKFIKELKSFTTGLILKFILKNVF